MKTKISLNAHDMPCHWLTRGYHLQNALVRISRTLKPGGTWRQTEHISEGKAVHLSVSLPLEHR